MIDYIKRYVAEVIDAASGGVGGVTSTHPDPKTRLVVDAATGVQEIVKELDTLVPIDFEPNSQTEFLRIRGNVTWLAKQNNITFDNIDKILRPIVVVLDAYRGAGSGGATRGFPFLSDKALQAIVERDYAELVVKNYPAGAWKSCVVLAGSILEAILFDRLADAKWNAAAMASKKVPKDKTGKLLQMDDWKLATLIDISTEIKLLPKDPSDTIHQVLRDYRNFVHPKKEIRAKHACTEAEAMLSRGALDSVCNYLEANP